MKRRTVLAGVAAAGAAGMAGCLSRNGNDDSGSDDDGSYGGNGDDSGGDSGTGSPGAGDGGNASESDGCSGSCEPPEITDRSIETTGTSCGSQDTSEASMRVEGQSVVVEGTLSASTQCHDAVLAGASIEDGQLQFSVGVSDRGGVCTSCIGEISYRTTIAVSDVSGLDSVQVTHASGGAYTFTVD